MRSFLIYPSDDKKETGTDDFHWSIVAICFTHFDEFKAFLLDLVKVIRRMRDSIRNTSNSMEILELCFFKFELLFRWICIVETTNKLAFIVFGSCSIKICCFGMSNMQITTRLRN